MRYLFHLFILLSVLGCTSLPKTPIQPPPHNSRNAVVFDIDGTLTPSVLAINEVRPDAAKAVTAFSDKGYKIIYLSARKLPFQSGLPKWFQENNFPEGALHVPQSVDESNDSETYKAGILNDYIQHGWQLEYAYGDSTTDFSAYSAAGIPKKRIFALKRRGKENCLEGIFEQCLNGWTEHLPYINNEVVVND